MLLIGFIIILLGGANIARLQLVSGVVTIILAFLAALLLHQIVELR